MPTRFGYFFKMLYSAVLFSNLVNFSKGDNIKPMPFSISQMLPKRSRVRVPSRDMEVGTSVAARVQTVFSGLPII